MRWMRWLAGGVAVLLLAGAAAWWGAMPAAPDDFYDPPAQAPATPGVLVRHEAWTREVPAGARGLRMLYSTTTVGGAPALASALVLLPDAPGDAPRQVVAWAHGTTGVARGCAPALLLRPFEHLPALREALAAGWAVVATDYTGLATPGVHPYLIGDGQARSVLDALRAAQALPDARLANRVVVWGHSQGGHAALWTGILARDYAPEIDLAGVAALAPATDLLRLLDAAKDTVVGRILSAYLATAYAAHHPEIDLDDLLHPEATGLVRAMAGRCLDGWKALPLVAQASMLDGPVFRDAVEAPPLGALLARNTPRDPPPVPVLLAQGETDTLVLPHVQRDWARARCAAGWTLRQRSYPARDHLGLVAVDSPLAADLVAWTSARFNGDEEPGNCADEG